MSNSRKYEVENLLKKLNENLAGQSVRDDTIIQDIIIDLSEVLATPFTSVDFQFCVGLLLGSNGVIDFCKQVASDSKYVNAKKSALDLFNLLLEKDQSQVAKYANDLQKLSRHLYNADKSAKVRCSSLNLLCLLLTTSMHHIELQNFNFYSFIEQLCLDIRANKGSLLLQEQLKTLGVLTYCLPEKVVGQSKLIYKVLKDQLIKKLSGNQPDLTAAAGAIKGLSYYFYNFPQGNDDTAKFYSEIYPHFHKLLDPSLDLKRREVQRAALDLLHKHGAKFSEDLLKRYEQVFRWLITMCRSNKRDIHKAAVPAMDTFIVVISNVIELKAEEDEGKSLQVFQFLLQEYNKLLETERNSSSQISLSVKGYAYLAGPCRMFLPVDDIFRMFNRVLNVSQQAFFQSSEMLENKLANLPSYIESLGIIINKMDMVTSNMVDSLMQLALALTENFPYVSIFKRFLAYRAFFTLIAALKDKQNVYKMFLHGFVYQFILQTCSHLPVVDNEDTDGGSTIEESTEDSQDSKWSSATGLKGDQANYKSFIPLWITLLNPEVASSIKVAGRSPVVITDISCQIYNEFLESIFEITGKLNLETFRAGQEKELESAENIVFTDPISGLQAKTPKDFQVYINLSCLVDEVIPLQSGVVLEQQYFRLLWCFIQKSSLQPLVSTHYSIITTLLAAGNISKYFESQTISDVSTSKHLLTSYSLEILQRCKQYKDQLLAACLTLILQLPIMVVSDIFPHLIGPLQMSLQLGLSYHPVANICIAAMHSWSEKLSKELVCKYFPSVLPQLLPYLRSQESLAEGELHTRVISVKMSLASQRRKVDQKKVKERKKVDISATRKIQLSILQLLGDLDQDLCFSIVPTEGTVIAEKAVAWDSVKHIKFSVPFQQTKLDVYLDELLPEVLDKAINSSDRQTKVASCELLHSIVIIMIGTGSQLSEELQSRHPMAPIYQHVFSAMLKLSCDSDNITRQLFLTLMYQSIHWFTNNRQFENPDTVVLLQAIMDGIITPNDPSVRDISARYLLEFLKWSRKQIKKNVQSPVNLKSILKRIISLCKHPSAFQRLGGCLAWNSIYQEVREDKQCISIWMFEILDALIFCLHLCEDDDPLLGTHVQCQDAIKHVERVFRIQKDLFIKTSLERRIPESMKIGIASSKEGTLQVLIEWLLPKICSSSSLVRHNCMDLLVSLVPLTQGSVSIQNTLEKVITKNGYPSFLQFIESNCGDANMEVDESENFQVENFFKELLSSFKRLLSSLDCYIWVISKNITPVDEILSSTDTQIAKEIVKFINDYAFDKAELIINKAAGSDDLITTQFITVSQSKKLNELKCIIIIRIYDFITELLNDGKQTFLTNALFFNKKFVLLIWESIFNPSNIGFNLKDTQVTKQLPNHLKSFLKLLNNKLPNSLLKLFKDVMDECTMQSVHNLENILPLNLERGNVLLIQHQNILDGLEILANGNCFTDSTKAFSVSEKICVWLDTIFFKADSDNTQLCDISPNHIPIVAKSLKLAVSLDASKTHSWLYHLITSTEVLKDPDGRKINKGTHILNILGDVIMKLIIQDTASCITFCVGTLFETQYCGALDLVIKLLKFCLTNAEIRQKYSSTLLNSLLHNWKELNAKCCDSISTKEALLSLLMAAFLVDREGILKQALKEKSEAGMMIMTFFKSYLEDNVIDLPSKTKALKLLPFFLIDEESETLVKDTLQSFSSNHLPLRSTEFDIGSTKEKEIRSVILEFLTALELTGSHIFLQFLIRLFCRECTHRYDEEFQNTLTLLIPSLQTTKQRDILTFIYKIFTETNDQSIRSCIMDKVMIPCLHHASVTATLHFFIPIVSLIMKDIGTCISGRRDEQTRLLVSKTGSFLLLQVLFSKLPKDRLFAPGSEINAAFNPNDKSGKELTKEIIKLSVPTAKGELRHDKTNFDLRLKCSCAAYNTLIAILSNVQDQLKFYTLFLFSENSSKNEAIFEGIIDITKTFQFDIEVNFNPTSKSRFIMVRHSIKENSRWESERPGNVKYIASHYLSDSSLREDVSQYDFTNSVVLSQAPIRTVDYNMGEDVIDGNGLATIRLDQSDFNEHVVMPNLVAIIHHMVEHKIVTLYDGVAPPSLSELPPWMDILKSKLETSQPRNIKLFILRLIMNTERVYAPYANHFVFPMINCIIDGTIGSNINYFIADLIVTVIGWGPRAIPKLDSVGRNIFSRTLQFLVSNVPHVRADIFKYNLSLVKATVENWKADLTVPQDIIINFLKVQNGTKREVEVGLQVSGILLVNNLLPYDIENIVARDQFCKLLILLIGSRFSDIYSAAAEVLGLYLNLTKSNAENSCLIDETVKKIIELLRTLQGQAIKCLFHIQQHFPDIVERLMNKLLSILPQLYGITRERALQCLIPNISKLENVFIHLKEQNMLDILIRKEAKTQLVTLQLVNTVLPLLKPSEVEYFLPGISSFAGHPAPLCREIMYEIFTWIYDTFSGGENKPESLLHKEAQSKLLQGIKEEDAALRQIIKNFWIQRAKDLSLPERLLFILDKLYSSECEDAFLIMGTHLLLEATHSTADFLRPVFQHPLTECSFREMKVSPGWKSRHASMIPLFADSQVYGTGAISSMDALVSLTQGMDDSMGETGGNRILQATQQYLFSATQALGPAVNDTYNWVTGATLDVTHADFEFKASHAPTQGSSKGLLFSEAKDLSNFKVKGLGKSRMNPDETDRNAKKSNKPGLESQLIRRRFVTNLDSEKQTIFFVRQEESRRRLRDKLEKERKLKREAQVTLHRQYRVGELPDIQIPYKAVITPLQALAERDESTASQLFRLLAQSIIKEASSLLSPDEEVSWRKNVFQAIRNIFDASDLYHTPLIRPLLELAILNDINLDPGAVSAACLGSSLEHLGILTLEQQLLFHEKQKEVKQPARKKQRTERVGKDISEDKTSIWLNITDMYKNLSMWDAVSGILKSEIGDLKEETRLALEYESENKYFAAYEKYINVLCKDWGDSPVPIHEQQVWEEWFIGCSEVLGKWNDIENFVESRLLNENESRSTCLNKIWENSRNISVFMAPLVNSKLMKILHGSADDNGLIMFVNDARSNPKSRALLESEMAMQLAVLAVNQEKMEDARSLLNTAQISLLSKLTHCSLLTPRSVIENLKDVQPLSELQDFMSLCMYSSKKNNINKVIQKWGSKQAQFKDHIVQSQLTTSFRDLFLHFLKPKMDHADIHLINDAKVASHSSVIKAAISNYNHHLAHIHLGKLEKIPKNEIALCQFYFLKTEASIVYSEQKNPEKKLQYLVEAWSKYLGHVDSYLKGNCRMDVEAQYLTLESSICLQICEAIKNMGNDFDPQCKVFQTLAAKFPSIIVDNKISWYEKLLSCSHNGIKKTINLLDNASSFTNSELSISQISNSYAAISSYYENCLEKWSEYFDTSSFCHGFIKTILKGMASGSIDAHYRFPRLMKLLDKHADLIDTFITESEKVPTWMFILWLSHILIYVDKNPGPALHPLILKIAKEYPQSLIYAFQVSRKSYKYHGECGVAIKALCDKVDALLSKFAIAYKFISAMSLIHLPHIKIKDNASAVLNSKDKSVAIALLIESFSKLLNAKKASKHCPDEVGSVIKNPASFLKDAMKIFVTKCGSSGEKLSSMNLSDIHDFARTLRGKLLNASLSSKERPNKLADFSPWLANFNALNYKEELEIPGQYLGHCKPMPEYHCKVASFNETVLLMQSIRCPIRIKINGSDEKEYFFLVKSGEDLRTDERIESIFSLLNNIYSSHPSCRRLSINPSLITYKVIPLSQEYGILEWVEKTQPLREFMMQEPTRRDQASQAVDMYNKLQSYKFEGKEFFPRDRCIKCFEECVSLVPSDLLRNGIFGLAVNHEGFFYLRSRFISSYSTLSISHWLLGIGDRHLANFLLNLKTGCVIGIDFGHHFESATLFLPVPELMPFRLTSQIVNAMEPLRFNGPFRETMIACLSAMKNSRQVLFAAVEAFVQEPTDDWIGNVARLMGNSEKAENVKQYSAERMSDFQKKLSGFNPIDIGASAVSRNTTVKRLKRVSDFKDIITGKGHSKYRQLLGPPSRELTAAEQVDILIEQATDPNILGRTFAGWQPYL